MRLIKSALLVIGVMGLVAFLSGKLASTAQAPAGTFYDFKVKGLDGQEVDFASFRDKYVLVVNTASKCGFTPQYAELEQLHDQYGDKVVVLGFPANNFLWQEPGTNQDIAAFCQKNYGVSFQMFEKVSVKGRDAHPLYQWLRAKSGHAPSWNFCKYLIDRQGQVVAFYPSKVSPLDPDIVQRISQ